MFAAADGEAPILQLPLQGHQTVLWRLVEINDLFRAACGHGLQEVTKTHKKTRMTNFKNDEINSSFIKFLFAFRGHHFTEAHRPRWLFVCGLYFLC